MKKGVALALIRTTCAFRTACRAGNYITILPYKYNTNNYHMQPLEDISAKENNSAQQVFECKRVSVL